MEYKTGEVARILELTPAQVRRYVRAGVLDPKRGPRRELRFSFQDVVFLKAARGLLAARLSSRRVRKALERLREQIRNRRGMSGFQITVEGKRIVATDGRQRWQPESGQIVFDFGVSDLARRAAPTARRAFREAKKKLDAPLSAEQWYEWGCELEAAAPQEAREAYQRALGLDPAYADALVNLGRLLHEDGDAAAAERLYRRALEARPEDATAAFNLGVALEDLGRGREALEAYERAVALGPENADAHFNAAALCETLGQAADALRHLKEYRLLTRGDR